VLFGALPAAKRKSYLFSNQLSGKERRGEVAGGLRLRQGGRTCQKGEGEKKVALRPRLTRKREKRGGKTLGMSVVKHEKAKEKMRRRFSSGGDAIKGRPNGPY